MLKYGLSGTFNTSWDNISLLGLGKRNYVYDSGIVIGSNKNTKGSINFQAQQSGSLEIIIPVKIVPIKY